MLKKSVNLKNLITESIIAILIIYFSLLSVVPALRNLYLFVVFLVLIAFMLNISSFKLYDIYALVITSILVTINILFKDASDGTLVTIIFILLLLIELPKFNYNKNIYIVLASIFLFMFVFAKNNYMPGTRNLGYTFFIIKFQTNPNGIAYLIFSFYVILSICLGKLKNQFIIQNILFFISLYGVYVNKSRTVLIAIVIYYVFTVIISNKVWKNNFFYKLSKISVFSFVLVFPIIYVLIFKLADGNMVILGKPLFTGRETLWLNAFKAIKEDFILGIGFTDNYVHAHNSFLLILHIYGAIIFAIYILLFNKELNVIYKSIKENNNLAVKSLVAVYCYLFIATFETNLLLFDIAIFLYFIMGLYKDKKCLKEKL